LLAAVTPTETLSFSLDHLGTPRVITRADRTLAGFHQYLPYGEEWTNGTGVQEGEPKKFTSHERDRDPSGAGATELDYMHARFYSGRVGRFLSVDPIPAADAPLKPQHWNRYTYAYNVPLTHTDPTGRTVYNQLSSADSAILLTELRDKTGLDLYYDENNILQSHGQLYDLQGKALGSATARNDLVKAMAPGSTHIIQSDPHAWVGKNSGAVTKLNFADIAQINTGNNPAATFDAASILIHEMIGHGSLDLVDFPGQNTNNQSFILSHPWWKGAVVDHDNKIRKELGLPLRSQYRTEQDSQGVTYIPFANGPVYLPKEHQ
jgi:RHS repeat-associated protein